MTMDPWDYEIGPIPGKDKTYRIGVVDNVDPSLVTLENPVKIALRNALSWMPEALFNVYYAEWVKTGDAELAVAAMRSSPLYDQYFAGNRRADGTLRWTEQEYLGIVESYTQTLEGLAGVNASLFTDKFAGMIESGKSPDEFFSQVSALVDRVLLDADEVMATYADYWGVDTTPEGLVAMALDPQMNDLVLNRQITMAEIGAAGRQHGFGVTSALAEELFNYELDEASATDLFGSAASWVPVLSALARRHADPDDDFDIEEFASAEVFADPTQRMRMRRLVAQERASFLSPGGFGVQTSQQTGGLVGLGPR